MDFVCVLTTEQREFLTKAYKLWAEQRGFDEYKRSFGVLKNVLNFGEYYKVQVPYIDNIREWYIAQLKNKN